MAIRNIFSTSLPVAADAIQDIWTLEEGSRIASDSFGFSYGGFFDVALVVGGSIRAASFGVIDEDASNPTLRVEEAGSIFSGGFAVDFDGPVATVSNRGEIYSGGANTISMTGNFSQVYNHGEILGSGTAVRLTGDSGRLSNTGLIQGEGVYAVLLTGAG
ncbi:MAG: hypothetical protein AAF813_06260, partial [Pseudomonadota bacterium]